MDGRRDCEADGSRSVVDVSGSSAIQLSSEKLHSDNNCFLFCHIRGYFLFIVFLGIIPQKDGVKL